MNIEQIKQILANAPKGATHTTDTMPSMSLYAKVVHLGGFYVSVCNRWEDYPIYGGIHLIDDLRTIVNQAERIAELEAQNDFMRGFILDDYSVNPSWLDEQFKQLRKGGE